MIIANILKSSKYIVVNALDMTIFLGRKIDASLKIITGTFCCCFCCNKNLYDDYYTKQVEILLYNRSTYELIKNNNNGNNNDDDNNDDDNNDDDNDGDNDSNTSTNTSNEDILDSYNVLNEDYINDGTLNINLPNKIFRKSQYY